jgi:uncharacterized membrane protein YraQ (UPF0718 family)
MEPVQQLVWGLATKLHYYLQGTYTYNFAVAFWDLFVQLWPFLVLGVGTTALISLVWRRSDIADFLQRSPRRSILTATLVGVVSPVPTYVAIPLVAALFRVGVPVAPLFAFLVASPLMNPVLFSLTAGAFGYELAILRTVSAVSLGILAAMAARSRLFERYFSRFVCDTSPDATMFWDDGVEKTAPAYLKEFGRQLYRNSRFIGKYFALGLLVAAAVKVLIPANWIISALGGQRSVSILVAVAAGIPLYACGGGTIPVLQTLQQLGMEKGAILAFFISGPATKLSTLVALKAALRLEVFLVYLAIGLLGACAFGFAYSIL